MHACCMTGFIKFPCKLKLASPLPSEILDPPLTPGHFISQYTNNIHFKNRSLALKPKLRTNKKRLAFITRFTPSAAKAMKIIKRFWPSLRNSKTFQHKNLPLPTLTFTSNKNIKSHLVKAKLTPTNCDTNIQPINFSLIFNNPQLEEVH